MIFAAMTSYVRRLTGEREAGSFTPALAVGFALGAAILLLALGWWLMDLPAFGSSRAVVIDVPPREGSSGQNGTGRAGGAGAAPEQAMMVPAPQPALLEEGPYGPLPKISADGRKPWEVYKRPSDGQDTRPRIAVVVSGIGLSTAASLEAIRRLPPTVTLSIDPYAAEPDKWAPKARDAGHEILLSLPVEASEFPFRDPGPIALLTSLSTADNLDRLQQLLSRCSGYVGVASMFGHRFEQDENSLRPVLEFLGRRGLMYVGGVTSAVSLPPELAGETEFPRLVVDVWIDDEATSHGIDRALAQLEATARERAVAIGIARNSPLTIMRLAAWAASLEEKEIALVPVSAIAGRQLLP